MPLSQHTPKNGTNYNYTNYTNHRLVSPPPIPLFYFKLALAPLHKKIEAYNVDSSFGLRLFQLPVLSFDLILRWCPSLVHV